MADSLFSSLKDMVDKPAVTEIAGALGQPEQSVSRGTVSSIAALLSGLATKADDSGALRNLLDAAPAGEVSWRQVTVGISDPTSPLVASGKRLLAGLFGAGEGTVIHGIGRDSGMGTGVVSTLMAVLAPMVMSFINKRVRDGKLNMSDLGNLLRRDSGAIRSALPAGLSDIFWPAEETTRVSPVVAQAVTREKRSNWLPALALGLLGLGLIWFLGYRHFRPAEQVVPAPTGAASRAERPPSEFVQRTLPNRVNLNIPEGGVESQLLSFIQDPNVRVDSSTWFNFDRLQFDTGSATLRPASQEQINNIAAIMTAYPNISLEVAGFTDAVGNAAANMELARDRANAVASEMINRGISPARLTVRAYGTEHPMASNETEEGRAQNRRVAMRVTQK